MTTSHAAPGDALAQALSPDQQITLPCGQSITIQPLLLADRHAFNALYAKALVALSVYGDIQQLPDEVFRRRLASVLMDGYAAELELTPGRSDVLDLLKLFCPSLCLGSLSKFRTNDFYQLIDAILEVDPDPFDRQRPGVLQAIGEMLVRMENARDAMLDATSSPSSASSDGPASTRTSAASATATPGKPRARKKNSSSATPPASPTTSG